MNEKLLKVLIRFLTALAAFGLLVCVWYMVYFMKVLKPALFPPPHTVFERAVFLFTKGRLLFDMYSSIQRVAIGVVLGVGVAVPVGFLLGWYEKLGSFFQPLINFFRALPPIALIPLVIVYFGIGETAKTIVLFYAAFFASVVVMYEGISNIDPIFVRAARTLGASSFEIFAKVVFPLSVPHILTALRVSLGVSWATLVAAELVAAQTGLGAVIQNASNYFQIPIIYMGIALIGILALIMDAIIRWLTGYFTKWQEGLTA
ncbi:MAG: ABC transporter permease [Desulfobacterales bacterium]|nr:MAG: ABC transporter permease [Desulfobacterales bacterium]